MPRVGSQAMTSTLSPPPLRWDGERLHVLDQTRLPAEEAVLVLCGAEDTAAAIERLAVRGAPLIGVAAAYGLAMEVARDPSLGALERGAERLATCRPTARNLAWAVERVHSGALAASGRGTGLGVIADLADRRPVRVLACEARPLLQGARLTVWELARLGIEHALVVDAAAAGLIRTGQVDAVVTGLDRVAANGDVANKVGTYPLALAAGAAGIPYVAAGPSSSVDRSLPSGDAIEIEERGADEVRSAAGALLTVPGTPVRNPAFDVTPAALVWALVTERGVARPVDAAR